MLLRVEGIRAPEYCQSHKLHCKWFMVFKIELVYCAITACFIEALGASGPNAEVAGGLGLAKIDDYRQNLSNHTNFEYLKIL